MIKIAAELEIFRHAENSVYLAPIGELLKAARSFWAFRRIEKSMSDMVGMVVRENKIVNRLFVIDSLNIPAHPFSTHALGGRQKRRIFKILRTEEVARVVEDRSPVGKTVKHILAASGVDKVKLQFTLLPSGIELLLRHSCAAASECSRNTGSRKVFNKIASRHIHFVSPILIIMI